MSDKEKISLEEVKKIPKILLQKMIARANNHLKKDETMQRICEEYGETVDIIDLIPVMFDDLDVSARTDHGIIYLNYKLLCDGDFLKDYQYLIHEYTHYLQQTTMDKPTQSADDGDYLSNPFEQEGFQNQMEYVANKDGEDEAEEYVDDLLKHHDVKNKKEKEEKKETLLALV